MADDSSGLECSQFRTVPTELLLNIFAYLPAQFLWTNVRAVCKHFSRILSDQRKFWTIQMQKRFPAVIYPHILSDCSSFVPVRACCSVERECDRWTRNRPVHVPGPDVLLYGGHFATVDAIHIMPPTGKLCLSGSRDRAICLWDFDRLPTRTYQEQNVTGTVSNVELSNACNVCTQEQAHKGWIWCLTSVGEESVYSGGWDCHVNQWQLTPTGLEPIGSAGLHAAILCVIAEPGLILASSFDHKVTLLDPKNRHAQIAQLNYHRGPVLSMVKGGEDSPYLFTCGQDKRIFCLDRRTWTPVSHRSFPSYAHSLCFGENQLWAATQGGTLALLNSFDLSTIVEEPVAPYVTVVRQVQQSLGSTVCISKDRYLRIFWPGTNIKCMQYCGPFNVEPSRFDYVNGNLAMAFGEGSVGVWHNHLQ